ncbi:MAG: helix-hairpin-helix domain-containing protein [bacterium]|nr:helix-hairpin-helix domain-containing protein [bacterium]
MNRKKFCLFSLLLLFFISFGISAFGIDYGITTLVDSEEDLEDLYYADQIDEDVYQNLVDLIHNPIDINRSKKNEIYRLPSLTEEDSKNIEEYVKKNNGFRDYNDLLEVEGIDKDKLDSIRPFIEVIPLPEKEKIRIHVDNVFKADYKWIKETSDDHYQYEDPYQELRIQDTINKTYTIGVIEALRYGSDGYEIYDGPTIYDEDGEIEYEKGDIVLNKEKLYYQDVKGYFLMDHPSVQIVLGNYQAGFGQGLVFNESNRRYLIGFKGDLESSSDYEKNYLFGGGVRYIHRKFELSGFYSDMDYKLSYQSGLVEFDTEEEYYESSAYQKSIPDFIHNTVTGGNFTFKFTEDNTVGITYYHNEVTFAEEGRYPEQYGPELFDTDIYGSDFQFKINNDVYLAGEFAQIAEAGDAWIFRIITDTKSFDMENSVRSYDVDFDNPHSYGFAAWDSSREYSDSDEKGFSTKMRYKIDPFIFEGDYDIWKHLSDLTVDTEYKIAVTYELNVFNKIKFSREWHDDDVARGMEEMEQIDERTSDSRITTYVAFDSKKDKFGYSFDYRLKQYVESSSPEYKKNQYYKMKFNYKPIPNLSLTSELKYNDDNLYRKQDSSSYEEYVEFQFRLEQYILSRHLKYTLGYKKREYIEDSGLRNPEKLPEETLRAYLTLKF